MSAPTGPGQFHALATAAERALRASPPSTVVVGAIPFDESTPAHLLLTGLKGRAHRPDSRPEAVRVFQEAFLPRWPPASAAAVAPAAEPPPPPAPEPPPSAYRAAVRDALDAIETGIVTKVVLARTLRVPLPDSRSYRHLASALLSALARQEPAAHLFSVTLPRPHRDNAAPVLVGATPETLLRRTGDLLTLTPLAGTTPRHPNPARDRAQAAALLQSTKDRAEHQYVVDALRQLLHPVCQTLDIPAEPRLHATSRLWHLATPIRARLRRPAPSSLALACALHPTPAVCGSPTTRAAALVRTLEPAPRRYFSGLIGWMNQAGDGHWVIALRCGEVAPSELRLYAGAGIVQGSTPEAEFAETEAKLATMLGALDDARSTTPPCPTPTGAPR
ncbi:isochorismate synthase [Streptomyces sp. ISL-98]|uniref:isochorismate synthase n=1 Tax=Streptomyces sp. ISL-98 TaxID=2819192 RepID=UPI001BE772E3|nr:isochorismate synthase [Streptomyces sp. ISL-98]MBT2511933.1 isochorismate synthase [Streptomyces sp. ISL-98]